MTPDVIGVLIAGATLAGGLFGGIWALLSRQTARLEKRFDRVEADIVELKVAVARLEGPRLQLVPPHR